MSNEHNDPGQDQLVAETYKAVARERVPDHLNERVLRMAANAGRTRYARARAWMRPAAWAATIGLSLAIVLELTQLPQPETLPGAITSPDQDAGPIDAAIDKDRASEVQEAAPSSQQAVDRKDAQQRVPATPAARQQNRETMRQFAPKDMAVLQEAENRARLQAGPDRPPASIAADAMQDHAEKDDAAVVEMNEAAPDPSCPSEVRENAGSWYKCIEDLRDRGLDRLANSEYDEFRRIFPDFIDPGTDK